MRFQEKQSSRTCSKTELVPTLRREGRHHQDRTRSLLRWQLLDLMKHLVGEAVLHLQGQDSLRPFDGNDELSRDLCGAAHGSYITRTDN